MTFAFLKNWFSLGRLGTYGLRCPIGKNIFELRFPYWRVLILETAPIGVILEQFF